MMLAQKLRIDLNRRESKYTNREKVLRLFWGVGQLIFRLTPRPCFQIRSWMLRCFGAKIGRNVHIYPSARIYFPWMLEVGDFSAIGENALIYCLGPVVIGERSTISHQAHLCAGTHNHSDPTLPLLRSPISIGSQVWVCADAFIGPNVIVSEGAVVGARAAVFRDVAPWTIVGGNPAKQIGNRCLNDSH